MPLSNPFTPAEETPFYIRTLLYGGWAAGKTRFGLTAPGPVAVFDTEGGTIPYGGLFKFSRLGSKSFTDLQNGMAYIEAHPGAFKTFAVDPVTVIYEVLQEAALRAAVARKSKRAGAGFDPENVDLEMLDWGKIKRNYKNLMTRLANLPCHLIVTARESDLSEKRGDTFVKVGVKPDAEKSTPYYFDCVIRAVKVNENTRVFTVEKARGIVGDVIPEGTKFTNPNFDQVFGPVIAKAKSGSAEAQRVLIPSDDDASARDVEQFGERLAGAELAMQLMEALAARGYDPEEVRIAKGWPAFSEVSERAVREALAKLSGAAAPAEEATTTEATEAAAAA